MLQKRLTMYGDVRTLSGMNIETRDQLDTHLDDARKALDKAVQVLVEATVTPADWTVLGHITDAGRGVHGAIEALPTAHSLQAS